MPFTASSHRCARAAALGLAALLCWAASCAPARATLHVIYPRIEERPSDDYGYKLLQLALARSGVPYTLSMSVAKMNQERARSMLERGAISVFDTGTSRAFESRFDAVYFPVDRGLSGYRLLLINRHQAQDFAHIDSLADLRKMTAGQGPGWADTAILNAAGIAVVSAEFESLFRMLNAGRFDFFPLGADESFRMQARYHELAPDLVVEQHLAIHYPFARLFFVKKGDTALRAALLAGLQAAYADGSLQQLLDNDTHRRDRLRQARLTQRTVIELDNPNLSAAFRSIPREYFYAPQP